MVLKFDPPFSIAWQRREIAGEFTQNRRVRIYAHRDCGVSILEESAPGCAQEYIGSAANMPIIWRVCLATVDEAALLNFHSML